MPTFVPPFSDERGAYEETETAKPSERASSVALYDAARLRIVELVRDAGAAAAAPVPACPGWTVGDVVAHLAGGLGDFLARRFDGVESGEWGERQVRDRHGRSVEENLAEWDTHRAAAGPLFDSPMAGVLVAEIVSHEHDIRAALNRPGAREDEAVRAALERPLEEIDRKMREAGLPTLRIVVDGPVSDAREPSERTAHGEYLASERRSEHSGTAVILGDGQPARTLRVSAFELLRSVGGRRSQAQVRALDWDGDPEVDVFALFGGLRAEDLDE